MVRCSYDVLTFLSKVCVVSIAAIFGVVTRTFVNDLFGPTAAQVTTNDSIVFFDLPANVLGCFVLGAFTSIKTHFDVHPLLVLAVSTGYAGSVTTFASWTYQLLRILVRGDWLNTLIALFFGICLPYCSLIIGRDFADFAVYIYHTRIRPQRQNESNEETSQHDDKSSSASLATFLVLFLLLALSLCLAIIAAILDTTDETRRKHWTSASFAPIGSTTRWLLSFHNARVSSFPLGTFAANILATLLDVIIGAVSLHTQPHSSTVRRIMAALITGMGGSLSTVSTWLNEASSLSRRHRYRHILLTIAAAYSTGILVYGVAYWVSDDSDRIES